MNQHNQVWRLGFIGILLTALPVFIVFQLVNIQVNPELAEKILGVGNSYAWVPRTIFPARGLLVDRNGNPLAANKTVYEVGVELRYVKDAQVLAATLSGVLGVDYADAFAATSIPATPTAVYAVVADNIPQDRIDKLEGIIDAANKAAEDGDQTDALNLAGVVYFPHLARVYPEKTLASNILGFVNREGEGFFGVEAQFNSLLTGSKRNVLVPLNPTLAKQLPQVPDGASLVLTIDREIQRSMEDLIDISVKQTGSESGTIVVMNPKTGEFLAIATTPRLDLNEFWRYTEIFKEGTPFNRALSQDYEPGSVFKVFTMSAGLDSGKVTPDTVYVDTGMIEIGGTPIYNWNRGAWGPQTMVGCMQHSLNVCLAWVATQVGTESFYRYLHDFGIGRLTGIDLAGEASGRLKMPGDGDWYAADLGINAFGQGVAVTPIQMAVGISAIANDGKIMAPHVVRSVISEGHQHDIEQHVIAMPIKPETAHTLTEMLAKSLEIESSDALVDGYRIAGKTGTAEIPTPLGYISNETNASFVGWGPVDDPQFLIYLWLEKPAGMWSSEVAAPVFRQAVERLVVLLNLPPDDVRRKLMDGK